jgi:hypothetical protein
MHSFDAGLLLRLMELVGISRGQTSWLKAFPPGGEADALNDTTRAALLWLCNEYEKEFIDLELLGSTASVKKMRHELAKPDSLRSDITPFEIELGGRLYDEMLGRALWSLSLKETEYYKNPRKGWEKIIEHFPDTVMDIEEASKCFAFSRYAAAIFHSVQVVEIGLIELGKLIDVTDPMSGWTATTNRLHGIIKKGHEARTSFERQHFSFLEQMHGTIEGLKNAWRNKISHAHGKLTLLTADFSPDIAEEILFATRAFMRRLATDAPVVSEGRSS